MLSTTISITGYIHKGISTDPNDNPEGKSNGPAVTNRLILTRPQTMLDCIDDHVRALPYSPFPSTPIRQRLGRAAVRRRGYLECPVHIGKPPGITFESARRMNTRSLGLSRRIVESAALTLPRDQNRKATWVRRGKCSTPCVDVQSIQ